ncbi:peptide chain release factor N(5)-glutamine methyltransferase [Marinobacter sp. SS21]|uniref:peptide chain release factor N(5)-glutamine methyltransferase n=1 Tax=Marinobacter sp. SS21 TaxID=2979460 RepID=UPI00232D4843|nr:peptide chain release factor N(5)-glutamine methyltransferase [Marinobacter sp. SS21]MDC0662549.1 peptide chain release factor N(5)-glutamine methyltransferase [Marinobacter sp. SS21]
MSESSLTSEALILEAVARIDSETPRLDAELLLSHVTGWSRTSLRAWPERELTAAQLAQFHTLLARRIDGEPIAHLLGTQDFWSLTLAVTPDTLIPRPDTECLVEVALALPLPPNARVLDLGTGTGAIALALASERPPWQVSACDAVADAVALARRNAEQLSLPLRVVSSHWFDDLLPQRFDLIVSNPPYIAADDHHLSQGDVRFEPATALVSGADGLNDLRQIVAQAPDWLDDQGWLVVEHGYDQADAVQALFRQAGFVAVASRKDYGGQDRLTLGQFTR